MEPSIGVIGVGWVGEQIKKYFEVLRKYRLGVDLHTYDSNPKKCTGDIQKAKIVFIAVPTPTSGEFGACDTSIVDSAVNLIKGEKIVVIKSTVPPRTTEQLQIKYPQHKLLFNPEFLTEKNAWNDFCYPSRQIVGFTERSRDAALMVLELLPKARFSSPAPMHVPPLWITATEAELSKLACNCFLSIKVVTSVMIAEIAEKIGAQYEVIREVIGADERIGASHLDITHGGYRGFGGYCLPKDFSALLAYVRELHGLDGGASGKLDSVIGLLGKAWHFNEETLREQGLTTADVSKHITDIEIREKRKKRFSRERT